LTPRIYNTIESSTDELIYLETILMI